MTLAESERAAAQPAGYSPPLTITLVAGGRSYDVAEVGPDFVKLRTPVATAAVREAILHFDIGGDVETQSIDLPDGIRAGDRRQSIRRQTSASASAAA